MSLRITEHSIRRFRERIEVVPTSDENIVVEMLRCLATAKPKHLKKIGKRTFFIPTERCRFICSGDAIVTVLALHTDPGIEARAAAQAAARKSEAQYHDGEAAR